MENRVGEDQTNQSTVSGPLQKAFAVFPRCGAAKTVPGQL